VTAEFSGEAGESVPSLAERVYLKGVLQTKIDLQKIVLRSVDDLISGIGKDSNMRRKAVFEASANVPEDAAMMIALARVDKKTTNPGVSVRGQVQVRRDQIQRIAQGELPVDLLTEITPGDGINKASVNSKPGVQPRKVCPTDPSTPCVVSNRSAILVERGIVCPKQSQVPLIRPEIGSRRNGRWLNDILRRNLCLSGEQYDCF